MIREDYRRALIMLRSLRRGVSGHARLERRTLLGTLQFTVSGTEETPLQGFLLGRVNGQWRGAALGTFGAPRYGQAGLTVRFDPRNLQGLTLEQYAIAGVAARTPQGYEPVLFGNLNGSVECTLECIRAECARLFESPPAASLPEADQPAQTAEEAPVQTPAEPQAEQTGDDAFDAPAQEAAQAPEADASVPQTMQESDALDAPAQAEEAQHAAQATESAEQTPETDALDAPARESTGRSRLALDECAWPESLQEMRAFFAEEPIDEGFTYDDYAFVRASLACVGGAGYCLIGVRARDGRIDSVCYAVPAQTGEVEPPAGLESYRREGDYWIFCQDAAQETDE